MSMTPVQIVSSELTAFLQTAILSLLNYVRFKMRIIDYFNILSILVNIMLILIALLIFTRKISLPFNNSRYRIFFPVKLFTPTACLLIICGTFLRFYRIGLLPNGLQQDEASIGYEAYCLANFGTDRNGYPFPVYPITWGSGGGSPLLIYLNVITTKLFGSNVFALRFVPAFLGSLTLVLFYLLLRKMWNERIALAGLAVLALTPWHIVLSRWSLDSNTMPFWLCLATLLFVMAVRSQKTWQYCLAAAAYSLCLYSYGAANVVIPLHLLIICTYCLRHKLLKFSQLIASGVSFLIVAIPLAIFYAVNFLGLPEIVTPYFSFQKFTSSHFGSVFVAFDSTLPAHLLANLKSLILFMTIGKNTEVLWNYVPGYWTLYEFTFPVTFLGIAVGYARLFQTKKSSDTAQPDAVMMSLLTAALIFALFIQQDINRMVMLWIPLVYCNVLGLRFLYHRSRYLFAGSMLLFMLGAISFTHDYFGSYNDQVSYLFMPGYGDAMVYADQLADAKGNDTLVYSTYDNVASPFMLTLYYTKTDPTEFDRTVVYRDDTAEFRIATSYGHFVFGLPDDITSDQYQNDVIVVSHAQESMFDADNYDIVEFGNYAVVSAK